MAPSLHWRTPEEITDGFARGYANPPALKTGGRAQVFPVDLQQTLVPSKVLDRAALDAEFAARVERALLGEPAPAPITRLERSTPELMELSTVAVDVALHRRNLSTALNRVRATTDADRPAVLVSARSAMAEATTFYDGIVNHLEANQHAPDAEKLCYELSPLHCAIGNLEDAFF